ncbi:hypothetical protein ACFVDU_04410 [Streptomyces albidoflavus]
MTDSELWTIDEVAVFFGYTGKSATGSARKTLSRLGVEPKFRQPGRGGKSVYQAGEVREAQAGRPGQGSRTDRAE